MSRRNPNAEVEVEMENEETAGTVEVVEEEVEERKTRGYKNPQPRLHNEEYDGPALFVLTEAEVFEGVLYTGRNSIGRAALHQLTGDRELVVYESDLVGEEMDEVDHLKRPFMAIYPCFREGDVPDNGSIVGLQVGQTILVGLVCTFSTNRKTALTVPLSGEFESYKYAEGSPKAPSTGSKKVDDIIVNALKTGMSVDVISQLTNTPEADIINIAKRNGISVEDEE